MYPFAEEVVSYLNLIHRLSVSENAGKTQNMVQCIANHIQYKYMRKDEIVKLKTELSQVDNLIGIFRARFGENLFFGKTFPEQFPDPYLPSNTILSLVESTLAYGLISKEGDWKLNVEIGENEGGLRIQVSDNGAGLTSSAPDPSGGRTERKKIIEEVQARLMEYFGEMEPLNVSGSGSYNKVTILVPRSEL